MPIPARPEEMRHRLHSLRENSTDRTVAMLHNKHCEPSWLLDHLVYEPFFDERVRHIKAQILAGLVLRDALLDRGLELPESSVKMHTH